MFAIYLIKFSDAYNKLINIIIRIFRVKHKKNNPKYCTSYQDRRLDNYVG